MHVVSPHGDATVPVRAGTAAELDGTYEAVLLAVKAMALDAAMADMAPAVGPETAILPVLNGMRHMDLLRARFGPAALAGCALKIATVIDDAGRIVQLNPVQDLAFGELNGAATPRMAALCGFLQGAGFDARLVLDITREMWRKWVFLAALGAITCLMRGSIGQVTAAPGGAAFARELLGEIAAVVTAEGHPPGDGFLAGLEEQLTVPDSNLASSMFRDLLAGQPVEADQILGDLLERGRRAGLSTPLLAAAFAHLCVYSRQVAAP